MVPPKSSTGSLVSSPVIASPSATSLPVKLWTFLPQILLKMPQTLPTILECEILNIGSDAPSWRRLSRCQCPRIDFRKRTGVSINGVIYFWHRSGRQLLMFNCEDESFQEIDLPPLASSMLWDCSLLEFRGHCAMVSGLAGDQTLQLWVLELEDQGQSLSYGWIHQVIDIPFGFRNSVFGFIGNLPTGEMLLASSQISNSAMTIYSYEHTEGKFETFEVGIFLSSKEASIQNVKGLDMVNPKNVHKFYTELDSYLAFAGIGSAYWRPVQQEQL
ncbi:hypothetical protein Vadar_030610 [Vaccinium darrowii]|uniref:Uncharacterized protein n=1 Tax=Vaccinium darrowii TaxID=229202 RepID=A0ACB7XVP4_9ERIC|nr:hypothetical protein Vadar_030610 [Vaccinium darrowii]